MRFTGSHMERQDDKMNIGDIKEKNKSPLRRIKLIVAYDGTAYCGFQLQPNGNTIQAELEKALAALFKEEIRIHGASRTDAGVHALGNVAVFDTTSRMEATRVAFALNTYLPPDIRIHGSEEVPLSFHPRFQETIKTYEYKICNRTFPDPCKRLYTMFYHYPLDVEKMAAAAAYFEGTHDFTSFCTLQPHVKDRTRTIYSATVWKDKREDLITFRVTGNGFLYNMVRIMAGTLLRVGGGMIAPEQIPEILAAKDRQAAAETARPEGLTLVSIAYPKETGKEAEGDRGPSPVS